MVFVISAVNDGNVLARIVMLFHRLNVEIDAIWMVRRSKSESMRIHVTVQAKEEPGKRLEAQLYKVVNVQYVATSRGTKQFFSEEDDI